MEIIARRAEGGMRDALSILDQALSLTQGNELTTAISEEITGTISLSALMIMWLPCLNRMFQRP